MLYTSNINKYDYERKDYEMNKENAQDNVDNIVYDLNSLYSAFLAAKKDSDWKPQVQKYEIDFLPNIVSTKDLLKNREYHSKPSSEFIINEHGKVRPITGLQMSDRVIRHSLCDNVLSPSLIDYLIYDNGASLKGKGIDFSRKRFEEHLHKYYRMYGNDGYILLMDYSKFYDNIPHDIAYREIAKHVNDEFSLWLLQQIFDNFKIDVSYMNDEEFSNCMNVPFNSTEYRLKIPKSAHTGEKYMRKSVNIGDQCSQIIGIFYPTPVDNFVKIVKGQKFYGRYMDDSYVIHRDREFLVQLEIEIAEKAKELGMTLNRKKTRIVKLSDYYKFLQITYSLTDTGRVIRKINPRRIVDMRRKLKKLSLKVIRGERTQEEVENMFRAWMGGHAHLMSKIQRDNLNLLYFDLFGGFIDGKYYLQYYPRRQNRDSRHNEWKQLYNRRCG